MTFKISENQRTLIIFADKQERKALREHHEMGGIQSDSTMWEVFEPLIANSELAWIDPADTGDLTSAPMLGIFGEERPYNAEDSTIPHIVTGPNLIQPIVSRWAFMAYELRSPLEDLRDTGKCVFIGGELCPDSKPKEYFPHDVCPKCGAASVPVEKVPDQSFRGCPKCSHTWTENLSKPATK